MALFEFISRTSLTWAFTVSAVFLMVPLAGAQSRPYVELSGGFAMQEPSGIQGKDVLVVGISGGSCCIPISQCVFEARIPDKSTDVEAVASEISLGLSFGSNWGAEIGYVYLDDQSDVNNQSYLETHSVRLTGISARLVSSP